jgi:hypothetical protein
MQNALRTDALRPVTAPPQMELFVSMQNTIYKRFLDFHIKHPQVFRLFEQFAILLIQKGHKKIGAKMIVERIRWEYATDSKDPNGFKINNDFAAHYARLFIKNHPEHMECFELREIRTL